MILPQSLKVRGLFIGIKAALESLGILEES
jgi:hypothetical protein